MNKSAWLLAGLALAAPLPPALQSLQVRSVEVSEVSTDRVRLRVHLGGTATRDVSLRTLTFDDASLNGVPLFVPPVSGPLRIAKGSPFSDAGAVEATVFYRDLPSLEPVRRMVREEKAQVRATVRLQPELSLLQRIALRTSSAWVSWKVEQTVKVQLPGGSPGKTATELALAAADAVWVVGRRGFDWRRERDTFTQDVRRKYAGRVLPVRTQYTVLGRDGVKSTITSLGLAFHRGGGEVIVPAEAVEPWMFDGAVAEAMAVGAVDVLPESVDVTLGSYSLRKGTLTVVSVGRDRGKGLSVERRRTFALRDRDSESNLARLQVPGILADRVSESRDAGDVAVFRRREDGSTELLMLTAAMENGRLRLVDPVDSRAFGSPVVGAGGVLGIVVSQRSIVSLSDTR